MKNNLLLAIFFVTMMLSSCIKGKSVDLVIYNAQIHTMDEAGHLFNAMAIKDGKIVEVGPERQIRNKYASEEEIDAQGKDIYPGFTDAHGHIFSYADQLLSANLVGSKSFDEVLVRLEKYQQKKHRSFIIGRGWDQSLWEDKAFPTNEKLSQLFPTTPVCLIRIDGHALIANDALLKLAKIDASTKIEGGIIHLNDGKCTGFLVDNAMNPIYQLMPPFPEKEVMKAILEIQDELLQYGITGVHEAGIQYNQLGIFKKLIAQQKLVININAMLMYTKENKAFVLKNGIYTNKNLLIRSFKVIGDGALGSRGAFLKKEYTDQHDHYGVLTTPISEIKAIAEFCQKVGYQLNTHAIGDSTIALLLSIYKNIYTVNKDHRWRIEHAQVVDKKDIDLFGKYAVFPSIQPTHAVSDQRWAEQRLGKERIKNAYAYKSLLNQFGMVAIGTDFPIELTDPFLTIHAAVQRKNSENFPSNGFYPFEQLSMEECLKGMTIWAAYAAFQEKQLGSLEKGKDATFAIFENKITSTSEYKPNFSLATYIKGKKVYSVE